jgi:hypothetical protein
LCISICIPCSCFTTLLLLLLLLLLLQVALGVQVAPQRLSQQVICWWR